MPDLERVRAIFLEAREHADRRAYLDEACDGNAELRAEVESLLDEDTNPVDFEALAERELSAYGAERQQDLSGQMIGRYRVLRPLGEGGFAIVYLAEQREPVRRQVALKVLKPGMDSRAVLARFETERQALAVMDHPCISGVIDGGMTEKGRPFFVMEHVKGVPITEYCDAERLTVDERVELFLSVCDAVHHAHQKGIIHRDLKPANILVEVVDGKASPKVIDFGIAKAIGTQLTEKTLATETGQLIGTPGYMSPEQAGVSGLDVDTRADVYSLGVVLYELLTGALPIDTTQVASIDDIKKRIREDTPVKPSTRIGTAVAQDITRTVAGSRRTDPTGLRRFVRGDLDWITMRALEKERARRYSSVAELAMDLRRHQASEPVTAGPPTVTYKLTKFVQRNRGGVIGATVVGVIIVVAVAIGLFLGYEASKARARAEAELTRAEAANDFLEDFILASNPFAAEGYATEEDSLLARLDYGAANLATALGDYPETEVELRIALATSYKGLGRTDKAVEQAELAMQIATDALGEEAELSLKAMNRVGLYVGTTDPERAIEILERFGELAPEVLGDDDPLTLTGRHNLALTYKRVGRYEDAEPIYKDVLKIRRRVQGNQGEETLITASTLAKLYEDSGRLSEAEPLAREVLRGHEAIYGKDHPETLLSADGLGSVLRRLGKYEEAAALHKRALEGLTEQLGAAHESTLGARYYLAQVQVLQGAHAEAETTFRELYTICREQFGPIDGYTIASLIGLTESLRVQNRPAEAEALLAPVLPQLINQLGWGHSRTWNVGRELGFALQDMGHHEEAIERINDVIEAAGEGLAEDDLRLVAMQMYVGKSLVELGEYQRAEPLLRGVDRLLESDLRAQAPTRVGLAAMVKLLRATGQPSDRYEAALSQLGG